MDEEFAAHLAKRDVDTIYWTVKRRSAELKQQAEPSKAVQSDWLDWGGCHRNGIVGNCQSDCCDTLMDGMCPIQDELDQEILFELGVVEDDPKVKDVDDAYERAMGIL